MIQHTLYNTQVIIHITQTKLVRHYNNLLSPDTVLSSTADESESRRLDSEP